MLPKHDKNHSRKVKHPEKRDCSVVGKSCARKHIVKIYCQPIKAIKVPLKADKSYHVSPKVNVKSLNITIASHSKINDCFRPKAIPKMVNYSNFFGII